MAIKIQINSKEALDRLIGDDPEIAVEIRKSVLESFAKSYIRSLANSEALALQVSSLRDEAHKQARQYIKDELGIDQNYGTLSKRVQSEIKSLVLHHIRDIVAETVKAELHKRNIANDVHEVTMLTIGDYLKAYDKQRILDIVKTALKEGLT